jgi:nucleotide sugar dehydrogenase
MNYDELRKRVKKKKARICIVGVGYVGLPLALAFSRAGFKVIGFDVSEEKIKGLSDGRDVTKEHDDSKIKAAIERGAVFTTDPSKIRECDVSIICVPTPVKESKEPDMSYVRSSAETVGSNLKPGSIVVLESTVYPGATEEIVIPALEKKSGLKCGKDFSVGYSPERINVGDDEHALEKIVKVVAGFDGGCTDTLRELYGNIITAGIFKAKDIKTAEAAKSIENVQRDLNIALANELALIFERMGIDVMEVLKAAGSKWNFHMYYPGLVGGHCIPEDPYFLLHKAKRVGYSPNIILAGRNINNFMPFHAVNLMKEGLKEAGKNMGNSKVLLMGLTFKKNVRDIRNTPVQQIITELKKSGADVAAYDPLVIKGKAEKAFGLHTADSLDGLKGIDCIALLTDHDAFRDISLQRLFKICREKPVIVDVRRFFDWKQAKNAGFIYLGFGFKPPALR